MVALLRWDLSALPASGLLLAVASVLHLETVLVHWNIFAVLPRDGLARRRVVQVRGRRQRRRRKRQVGVAALGHLVAVLVLLEVANATRNLGTNWLQQWRMRSSDRGGERVAATVVV